jgi:hypothetical protein
VSVEVYIMLEQIEQSGPPFCVHLSLAVSPKCLIRACFKIAYFKAEQINLQKMLKVFRK